MPDVPLGSILADFLDVFGGLGPPLAPPKKVTFRNESLTQKWSQNGGHFEGPKSLIDDLKVELKMEQDEAQK